MRQTRHSYSIFVEKPQRRRTFEAGNIWEDNIKMGVGKIVFELNTLNCITAGSSGGIL
jgi:hypothetical protein